MAYEDMEDRELDLGGESYREDEAYPGVDRPVYHDDTFGERLEQSSFEDSDIDPDTSMDDSSLSDLRDDSLASSSDQGTTLRDDDDGSQSFGETPQSTGQKLEDSKNDESFLDRAREKFNEWGNRNSGDRNSDREE